MNTAGVELWLFQKDLILKIFLAVRRFHGIYTALIQFYSTAICNHQTQKK
ncbi:MAG: hypothetical protein ACI9B7_001192 [Oleispira sp.]|jgi:hypothetical protein